ncbi:MAG: hypothetical protein H6810_04345 [Phycisphaeraceae bacterium]|nr:MAG: hypothetical protein H6810_04345 [Phycisphaeraceae bacterium]
MCDHGNRRPSWFMLAIAASGAVAAGVSPATADGPAIRVGSVEPDRAPAEAFERGQYQQLAVGEPITISGLPVGGTRVDLDLERFDVWTDDGVFFIDDQISEKPDIILLTGTVAGDHESRVVLGLGRFATNGFIETGGKVYSVSTGGLAGGDARITDLDDFRFDPEGFVCGIDGADAEAFAPNGVPVPPDPSQPHDRDAPCRVVRVAIDSDWEWTSNLFGGNAQASGEYALFLAAAASEIYRRDVNVRLVVPFVRTWSANVDPYTGTASPDPLNQVADHWRANMGGVNRNITHFLTGSVPSYGGVAWLATMCDSWWGYGVSSHMTGWFPYPLVNYNGSNWDLYVMSHEMGHNFGAIHTHEFNPPLDYCGIDCSGSHAGTIMSYCHTCSGGMNNIAMRFHDQVQTMIEDYLQYTAPCNLEPTPGATNDIVTTYTSVPVDIYALQNDVGPNCDAVDFASVMSPTPHGGTAVIAGISNPTGDPTWHAIRYTSAPGYTGLDTFSYTTTAGQSALVRVSVYPLRPADTIPNPAIGLQASYYQLDPGVSTLPDFSTLTPIEETLVGTINFASTTGNPVGGPLADHMGAVFQGYVVVPADGLYTFSLESDDGSRMYIGDDMVVENDGLHGMQTRIGDIALAQGAHAMRIEYFEYDGGAGLIFRWVGPTVSGVVPLSALRHSENIDCGPADIADPFGVLDLADINAFITGFTTQNPIADLDGNGLYDLADINLFINSFLAGCG